MLSEEKIRMMIQLADFEQGDGKTDLYRASYYKTDYIKLKVLQTILSVTLAYLLLVLLFLVYRMEFVISNAFQLDYSVLGPQFITIYVLMLVLFSVITIGLESKNYDNSKRKVKRYYRVLNDLIAYYKEEKLP